MENEINSADIIVSDSDPLPGSDDQGVGNEDDYYNDYNKKTDSIGPESKPVSDEDDTPPKKDTVTKKVLTKPEDKIKPIGSPADEPKKKKGILNKIFGKKGNN
jgi:penicillin-binding protein 1A